MFLFSIISIITAILSLQIGIIVLIKNHKSAINRTFFASACLVALWAVGLSLGALTNNDQILAISIKLAFFGWAFLPVTILAVTIDHVEVEFLNKAKNIIVAALSFVSLIVYYFFFHSVVRSGEVVCTNHDAFLISFINCAISNYCYLFFLILCVFSILILFIFKAPRREKNQRTDHNILIYSISFIFLFYFSYDLILYYHLQAVSYSLAHVSALVWLVGSGYTISRHKYVQKQQGVNTESVMKEMNKFLVFLGPGYNISNINKYSLDFLEHKLDELSGVYFPDIFLEREQVAKILSNTLKAADVSDVNLNIISRYSGAIPVNLSFSLIKDIYGDVMGIAVLGYDNRESKTLAKEIAYRQEVETQMQQAREELNSRIKDRTVELVETHKELQVKMAERMNVEQFVKADINEKEILINEIINRVKSNMEIIIALIDKQTNKIAADLIRQKFIELKHRIDSILLVHEHLYLSISYSYVDFASFIRNIVDKLIVHYKKKNVVKIKTHISDVYLNIDFAIPLGLVINELVSNALCHGFNDEYLLKNPQIKPEITISYRYEDGIYDVLVADNGCGLPEKIGDVGSSIGLQLTKILVNEQINGVFKMERYNNKTVASIKFHDEE